MAYKSKYYDPVKAHEYYEKHKKLKGRKKKVTIAGLSESGKIAAKEVKEQLQAELKTALKKVKRGNTAERKRLRELYKAKYEAELSEIYKDSSMVKQAKEKKQKQPKQAREKQQTQKQQNAQRASRQKSKRGITITSRSKKRNTRPAVNTETDIEEQPKTDVEKLMDIVNQIREKIGLMTDEQKKQAKTLIESLIEQYKKKILGEVNNEN